MFALRIEFHDGVSTPEVLLVRRSHAVIGTGEGAHVVLDGATSATLEFSLVRGLGNEFYCRSFSRKSSGTSVNIGLMLGHSMPSLLNDSVYQGVADLELGDASTRIWSLDLDLIPPPNEPPDKTALGTLRSALLYPVPIFPAFAVVSDAVAIYSFRQGMDLMTGRSRRCLIRTEASGVNAEHAKLSFDGESFSIEVNQGAGPCYINDELIDGNRRKFGSEDRLRIGTVELVGLRDVEDLQVFRANLENRKFCSSESKRYPALFVSSPAYPRAQRFVFGRKARLTVGRDPANDIWLQEIHISSQHLVFLLENTGTIAVTDISTNGTFVGGRRLEREETVRLVGGFSEFDLQLGLTISVCFSEEEELEHFPALAKEYRDLNKAHLSKVPVFRCEKALLELSRVNADDTVFSQQIQYFENNQKDYASKDPKEPRYVAGEDFEANNTEEAEQSGSVNTGLDTYSMGYKEHLREIDAKGVSRVSSPSSSRGDIKPPVSTPKVEKSLGKASDSERKKRVVAVEDRPLLISEQPMLSRTQRFAMGLAVLGLVLIAIGFTVALITK